MDVCKLIEQSILLARLLTGYSVSGLTLVGMSAVLVSTLFICKKKKYLK
jgi:hypothetical protein